MKRAFTLVSLLICFARLGYAQTSDNQTSGKVSASQDSAVMDLLSYLRPGIQVAALIGPGGTALIERKQEILTKVAIAMNQNAGWFRDSLKYAMNSGLDAYHEKYGLTEEEYAIYKHLREHPADENDIVVTGHDTLEITRNDSICSFRGTGELRVLDSLQIDLVHNIAMYKGFHLGWSGKIEASDNNNPLKSEWSGNEYACAFSPDMLRKAKNNPRALTGAEFSLRIGRLKNSGKTFLFFMGEQYVQGRQVLDIAVPCMFE